jgi:hypothetical protein
MISPNYCRAKLEGDGTEAWFGHVADKPVGRFERSGPQPFKKSLVIWVMIQPWTRATTAPIGNHRGATTVTISTLFNYQSKPKARTEERDVEKSSAEGRKPGMPC